jgi:site-specific recombinase XerD
VAPSQAVESASTNKRAAAEDTVSDAVARYAEDLQRAPLAPRTRKAYASHVAAYGRWLTRRAGAAAALVQPRARDHAARDFKRYLKVEQGWKPASVNLALAAVDHFNRFLGLGPAIVSREPLAQTAPRALSVEDQRALLRATEDSKPRDRAIVVLLLYTALRLSELVTLDVADARLSARKGLLVVRAGKGGFYREVPLNKPVRDALEAWLKVRAKGVDVGEPALFVGPQGRHLSARAVDLVIRNTARRAGLELSAHVLRHTCVTNLVRGGNDIVLVAELAGHRRLETTRRYSLPSAADRQAAMDGLEIEP